MLSSEPHVSNATSSTSSTAGKNKPAKKPGAAMAIFKDVHDSRECFAVNGKHCTHKKPATNTGHGSLLEEMHESARSYGSY